MSTVTLGGVMAKFARCIGPFRGKIREAFDKIQVIWIDWMKYPLPHRRPPQQWRLSHDRHLSHRNNFNGTIYLKQFKMSRKRNCALFVSSTGNIYVKNWKARAYAKKKWFEQKYEFIFQKKTERVTTIIPLHNLIRLANVECEAPFQWFCEIEIGLSAQPFLRRLRWLRCTSPSPQERTKLIWAFLVCHTACWTRGF